MASCALSAQCSESQTRQCRGGVIGAQMAVVTFDHGDAGTADLSDGLELAPKQPQVERLDAFLPNRVPAHRHGWKPASPLP